MEPHRKPVSLTSPDQFRRQMEALEAIIAEEYTLNPIKIFRHSRDGVRRIWPRFKRDMTKSLREIWRAMTGATNESSR